MHTMLAAVTKTPEIQINEIQARTMASAVANVARHYDTDMDQKTLDWINLAQVAGLMYGSMTMAVLAKRKANRPVRQAQPPQEQAPQEMGAFLGTLEAGPVVVNMETFR